MAHAFSAVEHAAATALAEWQKCLAGVGNPTARDAAVAALRDVLPPELVAQADQATSEATADATSRDRQLTSEQVTEHLHRLGLAPQDWDLAEICRKTNSWIGHLLVELAATDAPTWSPAARAEHRAEVGALTAVDFVEQCVIEAGPDTAPWRELQDRVDAGEFDRADPVWAAPNPLH